MMLRVTADVQESTRPTQMPAPSVKREGSVRVLA
jgi:hypothetical protein